MKNSEGVDLHEDLDVVRAAEADQQGEQQEIKSV
jgi:hypothetical protein